MGIYSGTHKKAVLGFGRAGRICLPIGIVFTALNLTLFIASIVLIVVGANEAYAHNCPLENAQYAAGDPCLQYLGPWIAGIILISLSSTFLFLGIAALVAGIVFLCISRNKRAEDIARGIDYSDVDAILPRRK